MRVNVSLSDGLLARVDAARGDVSRSRWIMRAVEKMLGEEAHFPPSVESVRSPHEHADVRAASPTKQLTSASSQRSGAKRAPTLAETWRR